MAKKSRLGANQRKLKAIQDVYTWSRINDAHGSYGDTRIRTAHTPSFRDQGIGGKAKRQQFRNNIRRQYP